METLTVALGDRAYPIHIGRALLDRVDLLLPFLRQPRVAIVTNVTVAPLYLQRLAGALRHAGTAVIEIILPDGEKFKDWRTLNSVFDTLLERRCERTTTPVSYTHLDVYKRQTQVRDIPNFNTDAFNVNLPATPRTGNAGLFSLVLYNLSLIHI